jgi:hypothetical protein
LKERLADVPTRDHRRRSGVVRCPGCGHWQEHELESAPPPPVLDEGHPAAGGMSALRCGRCAADIPLDLAGHVGDDGTIDGCPCCDYHTLCIQKDVNNRLGVILVAVVFIGLLIARVPIPWLVASLLAFTLLDVLLLRLLVKRLLICYRCKAQFRGFPPGAHCRPFDLATWEAHATPEDEA